MIYNTFTEDEINTEIKLSLTDFCNVFEEVKTHHSNHEWKSWTSLETHLARTLMAKSNSIQTSLGNENE